MIAPVVRGVAASHNARPQSDPAEPVKPSELQKQQGKKVVERMRREPASERYGAGASGIHERREQRKRDQAAGLVPFAVKLPADLVADLQERAQAEGTSLNALTAALLADALARSRQEGT